MSLFLLRLAWLSPSPFNSTLLFAVLTLSFKLFYELQRLIGQMNFLGKCMAPSVRTILPNP